MSFVLVGSNIPDRTPVTSNRVHRADDDRIYLPCDFMYGDATCLNDCVTFIKYIWTICVQVHLILKIKLFSYIVSDVILCNVFIMYIDLIIYQYLIFFWYLWFNKRKLMNLIAFCQLKSCHANILSNDYLYKCRTNIFSLCIHTTNQFVTRWCLYFKVQCVGFHL